MSVFFALLHYWYPVCLAWSTVMIYHRATNLPISHDGLVLYCLLVWGAYSYDRLSENKHRNPLYLILKISVVFSALGGCFYLYSMPWEEWVMLLFFALIVLSYASLKKFYLIKTFLVSLLWIWSAYSLALQNPVVSVWEFWKEPISGVLFLFFAAGCILCDFKDQDQDIQSHVPTFVTVLGEAKARAALFVNLIVIAFLSYQIHRMGLMWSSLAMSILCFFPQFLRLKSIAPLVVDMFMSLPGWLIYWGWV